MSSLVATHNVNYLEHGSLYFALRELFTLASIFSLYLASDYTVSHWLSNRHLSKGYSSLFDIRKKSIQY